MSMLTPWGVSEVYPSDLPPDLHLAGGDFRGCDGIIYGLWQSLKTAQTGRVGCPSWIGDGGNASNRIKGFDPLDT